MDFDFSPRVKTLTADPRTKFYRPVRPRPLHSQSGALLASARASQVIIDVRADLEGDRPGPAHGPRGSSPLPLAGEG